MFESCIKKQNLVKAQFADCHTDEDRYKKIIALGRHQSHLDNSDKTPANLVAGCQSNVFLKSELKNGLVYFSAEADALISAGLVQMLLQVYNEESPEAILKCPPTYLDDLGMRNSLSPNRSSGLFSIHLRMKQEALKFLLRS